MDLARLLGAIAAFCRIRAGAVVLGFLVLAGLAAALAGLRLGVSTDTDALFDTALPWRQRELAMAKAFPQFSDLLIAVVEGATPEEAEETAASLAAALAADTQHFRFARRPDADPWFARNALLFLDEPDLVELLDRTIDAQPFLGQLASDPSARGLFSTLALVAMGIDRGETALDSFRPALQGFERALADAAAGAPTPLSWQRLLAGRLADLAGPRRLVLAQARLDLGALEPGGAATAALRAAAAVLPAVQAGRATIRLTGNVALADEEFATVAEGAAVGAAITAVLVLLLLVLAVRSWRLILAIVATLALGLVLTTGFAALAVGTLNLISVAFAVLFIGIAVDFAIQFCVRYREHRLAAGDAALAMTRTMLAVGPQLLLAAIATAAGFLAFVPTSFRGVAELGLIAGVGMLIALACSLTFLPACLTLLRPRGEAAEIGYAWAGRVEAVLLRARLPVAGVFAALCLLGAVLVPRIEFDSDPLHTKNAGTEAMTTLRALMDDPLTSPYTADILAASPADADALMLRLRTLKLTAEVVSLTSLVPADQAAKLPLVADAASILGATLAPRADHAAPVTPADLRLAMRTAQTEIERVLPRLKPDDPLHGIARSLATLATAADASLIAADAALTRFLPLQLDRLRPALAAGPATLADLPAALARDWRLADGRVRVQVSARPEARDATGLARFADEVRAIAPGAGGSAVTITETADTIVGAFRTAALGALAAIAVLLLVVLRRAADVALVLGALIASALLTVPVLVLLPLPLNFANIVALPLLLGVGVSYNIYFVMNRRAGDTHFLGTATARAVLFSALTTATAFGALAASRHPGTASMGALLLWSLGATLLVSFVLLPVILAWSLPATLAILLALGLATPAMPARADQLLPPQGAHQGGGAATATWRLDAPTTAAGTLTLSWTDSLGRLVERRAIALDLRAAREIAIPLDLRRALAMQNRIAATLVLAGQPPRHAETTFIARPAGTGWTDWHAVMWQHRDAAAYSALQFLGVAGGKAIGSRDAVYDPARLDQQTAPMIAAGSRWYVENIATDFYANYHRWRPDRPSATWLWNETRRRHRENPADPTVNFREPSLSDPAWLARIQDRLRTTVRHQSPYRPYFYNLADEAGIADLAAAWDFDFAPVALAAFRTWLRSQYRDLAALNRQWGTNFAAWDAVTPPTTTQAMIRTDRNWSAWADFRAWMDIAFVRALRAGRDAVRATDPTALTGIAGAQIPGWGGYDYGRLATALDVIEIYNEANNTEIVRSLNPNLVLLSTSFSSGAGETGQIWRAALHGSRGLVIWDEHSDFLAPAGTPGPRGLALAPTLRELAGGLGAQLIASTPHHDQVAILYSQPSFRTQWMLARLQEGGDWTSRDAETEWHAPSPHRSARLRAARLLGTLGVQPRWLTPDLIAAGALRPADKGAPARPGSGLRLLVLPAVIALSNIEAAEIRGFVARGGTVLTMGEIGLYDGRSRLLARPQLANLAPASAIVRLPDQDAAALVALAELLARARVRPAIAVTGPNGAPIPGIETRLLRNSDVFITGLQRTAVDGVADIVLTLPAGHEATDLRRDLRLAEAEPGRLHLRLTAAEPALLALSPARLPAPILSAPAGIRAGDVAELRLSHAAPSPAAAAVLRLEVIAPDGTPRSRLSANIVLRQRSIAWPLPLAADDPPGLWQLRVIDMLTGGTDRLALPVLPAR